MEYSKLKSGTDIRGVAVEGVPGEPVTLTDEVVETIAAAFLVWCEKHLGKAAAGLKLAVGHDSRISADRISAALQRYSPGTRPGAGLRFGFHALHVLGHPGFALRLLGADYGEPPPVLPQRTEVLHACGRP